VKIFRVKIPGTLVKLTKRREDLRRRKFSEDDDL
jgi:hypothetical protein